MILKRVGSFTELAGWVPVTGSEQQKLLTAGAPMVMAVNTGGKEQVFAPSWAKRLVTSWPDNVEPVVMQRVIRVAYMMRDRAQADELADACGAAARISGEEGVRLVLAAAR